VEAAAARTPATLTWLAAAFGAAACALAAHIGADAPWLAAIGAAIAHAGSLPHSIPYAAAPGVDWHDAPALGQLVLHLLQAALGDKGFLVAQVAAVGAALGALALDLRRARVRDGAGAAVVAAVVLAAPASFLVVRAQLFSLALFPLLVLLLRGEAERPSRRIWLAVPLLALWANLHGGVLLGFAVLAAYLLLERLPRRRLEALAVLAASALGLLATPALLDTPAYYAGVLHGAAAATHYGLWAPLSYREPLDVLFAAVGVALLASALRRRPRLWELVVLLALAALAVEARRNAPWLLLFVATPAAGAFGRAAGRPLLSRRIAAFCACVPLLMLVAGLARQPAVDGAGTPLLDRAAAVAHGTPILSEPLDAERLAVEGRRIWIGNPLDAFVPHHQRLYLDWLRGRPDGDAILAAPVRVVLVRRGSAPQRRLAAEPGFREVARDAHAVLYTRRG
jgi:hypothetical protein